MDKKTKEQLIEELSNLKKENEKLKRSHEKLHSEAGMDEKMLLKLLKAVNTISDAIFVTDTEGIITYINNGFTALYGFTSDEVVGRLTPRIIKSGLLDKEVYKEFWKILQDKQEVKGEIVNRKKNGEVVYIDGTASPILDENGTIIGFLGIQRDISQRKREEDKLKSKIAENQKLYDSMMKKDLIMVELKKEINDLLRKSGNEEKYMVKG